jgi:GNAT superfamily N-acetyltransferase
VPSAEPEARIASVTVVSVTTFATGAAFIDGKACWIGVGGTLASHRGRGAQSALLAARIETATHEGCTTLTTETGVP